MKIKLTNIIIFLLIATANKNAICSSPVIEVCPDCKYQKIIGWGISASIPEYADDNLIEDAIDLLVNELGLNRLRLDFLSGNRATSRAWEWYNDNGDPEFINFNAFSTDDLKKYLKRFVIPFKEAVESKGQKLNITLRPTFYNSGSSGRVPIWLLFSPAEYCEFIISKILFLKDSFDINTDYIAIINEPGNNNPFNLSVIKDISKHLVQKFNELNINAKIQFPETYSPSIAWDYLLHSEDDEEFHESIGLISYHSYNPSLTYLQNIFNFADYYNKPTAQTEYFFANTDNLYNDLTIANTSIWDFYFSYSVLNWNISNVTPNSAFWNFRQFIKYAPPGSNKISSFSTDTLIKPISFRMNDDYSLMLINKGDSTDIIVKGLPKGSYAVNYSIGGVHFTKGIFNIEDKFNLMLEAHSITTIYTYHNQNLPPVINYCSPNKNFLTVMDTQLILTVTAVDPELDSIIYKWSVISQPPNSNISIKNPENPVIEIDDIKIAGEYRFKITASDGFNEVEQQTRVHYFNKNNPPQIFDVHNRLPVQITLPIDSTELRASVWDIESDTIFVRWSLISSPNNSQPILNTPNRTRCVVRNLSESGIYKYKFTAYDNYDSSDSFLEVPVYPVNQAPVIRYIFASDTIIDSDIATTNLYSDAYDPDNDTITHWWAIASAPYFAKPIFDTPSKNSTVVRNLTIPGEYKFVLRVIDRTLMATDTISINVQKSSSLYDYYEVNSHPKVFPNPFIDDVSIIIPIQYPVMALIRIINTKGQAIKIFKQSYLDSDNNTIFWDGFDNNGNQCPSGLYLCVVNDGFNVHIVKILKY